LRDEIAVLLTKAGETFTAARITFMFWTEELSVQQITQLLELKQKQANASEARTTRMQAEQSDRQGKVYL
jgi:hypothetical protein